MQSSPVGNDQNGAAVCLHGCVHPALHSRLALRIQSTAGQFAAGVSSQYAPNAVLPSAARALHRQEQAGVNEQLAWTSCTD